MSVQVHPFTLLTGQELMSGPIIEGGMTRQEKEIQFVMENIDNRLIHLKTDEIFEKYKAQLFSIALFIAMGGVTLILFGLHMTIFFEQYKNRNIPAIVFGTLFLTPLCYWFYYLFLPNKDEKEKRRLILKARHNRRKPTLFNQMIIEAEKATRPPPKMIRILAHIRKHDYPFVCSTMQELSNAIADQCGLTVERQLLRFNEKDLEMHLDEKLDEYYGMANNDRVHVYNKGGYYTNNSPLKRERVDIIFRMQQEAAEVPEDEKPFEVWTFWKWLKNMGNDEIDTSATTATRVRTPSTSSIRTSINNDNNIKNNSLNSINNSDMKKKTSISTSITLKSNMKTTTDGKSDNTNINNKRKESINKKGGGKVSFHN